ncbi:hypothetical protein [Paraburkholderia phenoliruptrix]|uniref:hypothetical protein n=1 Tax=Paraburkholderia phenoliruptrix TaxID=252970 RepID=UPI00285FB547|nr:hypothetical protein [Paraburkholderia phenoliruptrix]MDR6393053.1 hypothetical protein [Paraburkholderia phenoliruptrix]
MTVESGQVEAEVVQEAELSLRDEIVKNLADLKGDGGEETGAVETPVAATLEANPPAEKPAETQSATPETPAAETKAKAPQSWSAAERAHWDKIPVEVQAVIARREEEAHRGITTLGQDAAFGKKLKDVISPYLPIIRAEGGDEAGAVRDLLQTAYTLRTASPEQKIGLFRHLAGQFGVDLSVAAQGAPQVDPELQSLRQELAQLKGHLTSAEQQQHQHVQGQAQAIIDAFAADPKNEFYEQVKPLMAHLLVAGQAKDMQEAYDMACHANPDVRSTILTRQQADAEAKRAAEAKAKVDAKRKAAGSISGSPAGTVSTTITPNQNLSLRDELRQAFKSVANS